MKAVTYEYARENFDDVFNMWDVQSEGVLIVKEDKSFVLMDKDLVDSLFETMEIAPDKSFVASLKEAEKEIERGEAYSFEDAFRD